MSKLEINVSELVEAPLWWQEEYLPYTSSGYGVRIPTRYKVKIGNRLRRVYAYCVSNAVTHFIGKSVSEGQILNVEFV
jgi:hypothetical protein